MSINKFCSSCKGSYKLSKRKCQRCDLKLVKFRVRTKNLDGITETKVCDSLPEAQQMEYKIQNSHNQFKFTLDDIFFQYIDFASNRKASWKDDDQRYEKYVHHVIGHKRMNQIRPMDVQQIIDGMHDKSPATQRQVYQVISRLFNWSKRMHLYHGSNPCTAVQLEPINNERVRYLSPEERERLEKVLNEWPNERAVLLVLFLMYTGKRKGEVCNLRWENVDLGRGFVTFIKPKGGKKRTIALNDYALAVLKRADQIRISNYVFPTTRGTNYYNTMKDLFPRMLKKAKIEDFTMHDLRHNFASTIASSGEADIYVLQKLLDHKTLAMTMRYAHLFENTMRKAAKIADKGIGISVDLSQGTEVISTEEELKRKIATRMRDLDLEEEDRKLKGSRGGGLK